VLGSVTAANIVGTLWTYEVIVYGHFAEGAEKFTAGRHRGETRSASLREGFDGGSHGCYASVCRPPWPTLGSTNCFESMISVCREHAGNVKCWSAVYTNGHLHLPSTRAALQPEIAQPAGLDAELGTSSVLYGSLFSQTTAVIMNEKME